MIEYLSSGRIAMGSYKQTDRQTNEWLRLLGRIGRQEERTLGDFCPWWQLTLSGGTASVRHDQICVDFRNRINGSEWGIGWGGGEVRNRQEVFWLLAHTWLGSLGVAASPKAAEDLFLRFHVPSLEQCDASPSVQKSDARLHCQGPVSILKICHCEE